MTPANAFRRIIKTQYPQARLSIRTVSFSDLARASASFVDITNVSPEERRAIRDTAREFGFLVVRDA